MEIYVRTTLLSDNGVLISIITSKIFCTVYSFVSFIHLAVYIQDCRFEFSYARVALHEAKGYLPRKSKNYLRIL